MEILTLNATTHKSSLDHIWLNSELNKQNRSGWSRIHSRVAAVGPWRPGPHAAGREVTLFDIPIYLIAPIPAATWHVKSIYQVFTKN